MTNFVNNPNGLSKTVLTPEVRAQSEAESRSFTRLLGKMSKKGLSFNGDDAFIDSASVKHYDKYGAAIEQPAKPVVIDSPEHQKIVEEFPTPTQYEKLPGPPGIPGPVAPQRKQGYIGAPVEVTPQLSSTDVIHYFKVYDPVQQQILIAILDQ